jgi:hypothetical protein
MARKQRINYKIIEIEYLKLKYKVIKFKIVYYVLTQDTCAALPSTKLTKLYNNNG